MVDKYIWLDERHGKFLEDEEKQGIMISIDITGDSYKVVQYYISQYGKKVSEKDNNSIELYFKHKSTAIKFQKLVSRFIEKNKTDIII